LKSRCGRLYWQSDDIPIFFPQNYALFFTISHLPLSYKIILSHRFHEDFLFIPSIGMRFAPHLLGPGPVAAVLDLI
jgi:hypothetical protein